MPAGYGKQTAYKKYGPRGKEQGEQGGEGAEGF